MMPIILSVVPSKSTRLRTLLHFYREVCPKHDEDGKLRKEMILAVCVLIFFVLHIYRRTYSQSLSSAIRNDQVSSFRRIAHPNMHSSPDGVFVFKTCQPVYTCGATHRFLQQISREAKLLEPLTPPSPPTLSINIPPSVVQPCFLFRTFIDNIHLSFPNTWESSYLYHQLTQWFTQSLSSQIVQSS